VKKIKVRAHAKINLFLEILRKRSDGYHEIETILQSIALFDELVFSSSSKLEVVSTPETLIPPESNLALKAAQLLRKETGTEEGAQISITKNIPIGAGLGGASADAAASLVALNALWQLDLPFSFLHSLAAQLGADVPFCLRGGTALGRGRGEKLEALPAFPFSYLVVAKPPFEVLTSEAYRRIDSFRRNLRPPSALISALHKGDLRNIGKNLYDAFETLMAEWHPEILESKRKALEEGALGALMTGSGSAVFAIAEDKESAQKIANELGVLCPSVFVTTSYPRGLDLENSV
jgi:4-diphosphocytidyl-2-C-methyl-D-erythritol kinase